MMRVFMLLILFCGLMQCRHSCQAQWNFKGSKRSYFVSAGYGYAGYERVATNVQVLGQVSEQFVVSFVRQTTFVGYSKDLPNVIRVFGPEQELARTTALTFGLIKKARKYQFLLVAGPSWNSFNMLENSNAESIQKSGLLSQILIFGSDGFLGSGLIFTTNLNRQSFLGSITLNIALGRVNF